MASQDTAFSGSIPALYDLHLGPLLFEPYARLVAGRSREWQPKDIIETAAGTGIVTAALHRANPHANIVATDLNPAMIEIAQRKAGMEGVRFRAADALDLPFTDESFDLVVCQFGVMFFPDRARGNAEARRVLRGGGHYLSVVWDRLASNPVSNVVHNVVTSLFPADPPGFLARTPFGYSDPQEIERDLETAGFAAINIETVALESDPTSARDAARGLIAGTPLRAEIEARDPRGLERAVEAVEEALWALETGGRLRSTLSAHIVIAER